MPLADLRGALPPVPGGAVPKRRREFAAGRACALRALEQLGIAPEAAAVGVGAGGAPAWPEGVVGSISHGGALAWAAVARERDAAALGIDMEPVLSAARAERLCKRIAAPAELSLVAGASGLGREAALTLIFSAKESLFKALYPQVGRVVDYLEARVVAVDAGAGRLRLRLNTRWSHTWPAASELDGRFLVAEGRVDTAIVLARRSEAL